MKKFNYSILIIIVVQIFKYCVDGPLLYLLDIDIYIRKMYKQQFSNEIMALTGTVIHFLVLNCLG